jgi:hypothetical protein
MKRKQIRISEAKDSFNQQAEKFSLNHKQLFKENDLKTMLLLLVC